MIIRMKNQTKMMLKKKIAAVICFLLALPVAGFSQPATPNGGGQTVDAPTGVPFDDTMNLVFLAGAVIFAAIVVKRQWRKKTVA